MASASWPLVGSSVLAVITSIASGEKPGPERRVRRAAAARARPIGIERILMSKMPIEREVKSEIERNAPSVRRNIEGKHVRSLEELSASIAHEIRNPITAAKSLVQQMGEDPSAHENGDYAKVGDEELDRVERIL